MIWDTHIHSHFSSDSTTAPEAQIESAIQKNLPGICFTDHCDLDYPLDPTKFQLDFDSYFATLKSLSEKYASQIEVCIGVEMGLQPHLCSEIHSILNQYPFDFCIGSSHIVNLREPSLPSFYKGRSQHSAYRSYFESILENLTVFSDFDVYGHLDYVVRYGPDKDLGFSYSAYADILDEILKQLIQKGKGIEVNTGGYRCGLLRTNPGKDVLTRYKELGGELITIGSDGHTPDKIALEFERIPLLLKSCGFSYYCVFKNRRPIYLKLS
ncbi:MAG: histidinol-phosphatase HisJ family protein [Lachnospiraceae bacterium]